QLLPYGAARLRVTELPWVHPDDQLDNLSGLAADDARLHVDHMAGKAVDGFLDRLAERRVSVDVACHFVNGEVPLLRQRELGQQFGDVGADEVGAEQLAVLVIANDLHKATRLDRKST